MLTSLQNATNDTLKSILRERKKISLLAIICLK
nr:MAG TPA: hypothetical protein [Caudoviricetes sp.]